MTNEEKKWREEHDAYEQLHILHNWCQYEDYDILYSCKNIETLLELYLFVNFDCDMEFVQSVQDEIEEYEDWELLNKCLAWDKAHGTHFWYDPR